MPAEHMNEHGQLEQGYFCSKCGGSCGMYGHMDKCEANPEKVRKLAEINTYATFEEYIIGKLKGDV